MKKSLPTLIFICLISTFALANPLGQSIEMDSITRLHLPTMKLDLMAFASGLEEIDETQWCETRKNHSEVYTKAMLEDIKKLDQLSLTVDDVKAYSKAYADLFELCSIAEGDSHLESHYEKYVQDFDLIESVRNILIDELPLK